MTENVKNMDTAVLFYSKLYPKKTPTLTLILGPNPNPCANPNPWEQVHSGMSLLGAKLTWGSWLPPAIYYNTKTTWVVMNVKKYIAKSSQTTASNASIRLNVCIVDGLTLNNCNINSHIRTNMLPDASSFQLCTGVQRLLHVKCERETVNIKTGLSARLWSFCIMLQPTNIHGKSSPTLCISTGMDTELILAVSRQSACLMSDVFLMCLINITVDIHL